MLLLQLTLTVKIALTVTAWSLLPILHPRFVAPDGDGVTLLVTRGLGMSNLALVVMYAFGLWMTMEGAVPWFAIAAGLVSNGGGALLSAYGWAAEVGAAPRDRWIHAFNAGALACVAVGLASSAWWLWSAP